MQPTQDVSRDKFLTPLQLASGVLLVLGWCGARYVQVLDRRAMAILFGGWLIGAVAAAFAWKISSKRRSLSLAACALNVLGLAFLGITIWAAQREIY